MRLFEAILDANHRAVAGDASAGLHPADLGANRHFHFVGLHWMRERKADAMNTKIVIEAGEDGYFVAHCPSLKSCWSQGKTREEALRNIREAIVLYLEPAHDFWRMVRQCPRAQIANRKS